MQREQEKSSAASAVARTQHSSFQYHQQISYAKVMPPLYLSLGGAWRFVC
jgi:hypothetical protein